LARADPSFKLTMHIVTDEGDVANVKTGAQGYLDGIQSEG
jgi:acetate kinase